MKSGLQVHSRQFLKAGGIALVMAAAWQVIWLYQSMQTWEELSGLMITTSVAMLVGMMYSRFRLTQPKWLMRLSTAFLLLAYLISIHQTQDSRLMVGLIISLLILLVLVVD